MCKRVWLTAGHLDARALDRGLVGALHHRRSFLVAELTFGPGDLEAEDRGPGGRVKRRQGVRGARSDETPLRSAGERDCSEEQCALAGLCFCRMYQQQQVLAVAGSSSLV